MKNVAIIGGGAAGFFSAICTAQKAKQENLPLQVTIFESSSQYLKKVRISGGGRCNVTHNCFEVKTFVKNYPRGSKELISPMQSFQAEDTLEWFKKQGINIVAEPDGRMFPDTNSSETIIDCYMGLVKELNIKLESNSPVMNISAIKPRGFHVHFKNQKHMQIFDAVLIATGSANKGYELAQSLGHQITSRAPSLFSFKINHPLIEDLQGLSFPNSKAKLQIADKKIFKQQGPTLITHWGLSGPAILKLSAWAAREMKEVDYKALLTINWLGLLKIEQVVEKIEKLKADNQKNLLKNSYPQELPKRFWLQLLDFLSIDKEKQWANVSKKDVQKITRQLFQSELKINGQNRFKDEFVECGGVRLSEINFKTMESKICPGLFFAGEILDVDGITGGFNFQNAWTTGWLAAQSMATPLKLNENK